MTEPSKRNEPSSEGPVLGRVLVVDDEHALQRVYTRALREVGHVVETASDGLQAEERLRGGHFDAIVSDISMPGLDGIGLLRSVRAYDLDLPVILLTGQPDASSAQQAVAYGATMYLVKPVEIKVLQQMVAHAVRLRSMARLKREFLTQFGGMDRILADRAGLEIMFSRALSTLWMAYQPIVTPDGAVYGYEALVRSKEGGLPHPGALLDAAERVGRMVELGRGIRDRVASDARSAPGESLLFINLHTLDLLDDALYDSSAALSAYKARVVLEITERASLDQVKDVEARIERLRDMGFRIAVDDLGAGYSGLTAFAQLKPGIVKIDMSLVRDVDRESVKQKLIRAVTALCHDMGICVVAEGVETRAERDALVSLGCDLLQGYLFAKPSEGFWRQEAAHANGPLPSS